MTNIHGKISIFTDYVQVEAVLVVYCMYYIETTPILDNIITVEPFKQ